MRVDGDGVPRREKRAARRVMGWKTAIRPLWLVTCLTTFAARLAWGQLTLFAPSATAAVTFPALSGRARTDYGEKPLVGVRISVGGEFWTGAKWEGAAARPSTERPPPNEFLSAVVAEDPNGGYLNWAWSLPKHLPEGSSLPEGMYHIWVIIRGTSDGVQRDTRIDRQDPRVAIASPPQTETPGRGYHHDLGDPYLTGPKGNLPAITGTVTDDSHPIRVEVFFQREEDRWWWQGDHWFRRRSPVCDVTVSGSLEWRCDLVPPPDSLRAGGYRIAVEAVDGAGNRTQTAAFRNVVVPLRQLEATKRPQSSDRQPESRER